jgi:hypothetical protein
VKRPKRGLDTAAIKEAAARLGITVDAVYRRLRQGRTWEEAVSEGPYGHRLRVAILKSASRYIYGEAQQARGQEEHEDFSITLKLLELLREGWSRPGIFDVACGFAVGLGHARYLFRRAERAAFMRREFLSITPDYDYSRVNVPDRDPADGRRHYGNKYASRGLDTAAIKEAAARLGITVAAVYRRLRQGRTWEEAISEGPYGHRLRALAAERVARHDSTANCIPDEDIEAAGGGFGERPTGDDRHHAPNRARAAGYAALPAADRRGAPKRISSPAQAQREKALRAAHRAAAEREIYFGA